MTMNSNQTPVASTAALQRASQAWCQPNTQGKVMDPELVEAFAQIIDSIWSSQTKPKLDGLRYALAVVEGRRVLSRPVTYIAALDEISIFLRAAIERVEMGETMNLLGTTQS